MTDYFDYIFKTEISFPPPLARPIGASLLLYGQCSNVSIFVDKTV